MPTDRRYFKEMRFRQLRALVELARHRTFSAVAVELGLSVSSTWQQVRALEEEFGVQLVVAKGHQVALTEDGRLLLALAEPLVEGFLSLRAVFQDRHSQVPRTLTVVAPAGVISNFLPKPVMLYRQKYPKVRLTLVEHPSAIAIEELKDGKADVALAGLPEGDELPPALVMHLLARFPMQMVCPADHPLAATGKLTLKAIVQHPLVLASEGTTSRIQVNRAFAKAGLLDAMNVTMSAGRTPVVITYVKNGLGIALMAYVAKPKGSAKGSEPELTQRDATHLFGHEQLMIMHSKSRHELPHVRAFRELVQGQFATAKA